MHRIWYGDLSKQLYAIELCLFLDRLHAWAINKLRRWISECISELAYRLTLQSGVNADRTESNIENSGIDLYGTSMDAKQEGEMTMYEPDQNHVKESKLARDLRWTSNFRSEQNSKLVQGLKSAKDSEIDDTPLNDKAGSEHVPSQQGDIDSDYAPHSDCEKDSLYESCLEENAGSDDETVSAHKTDDEESASSEGAMKPLPAGALQPQVHYVGKMSKPTLPETVPLVVGTSKQHEHFSTSTKNPVQRVTSVLDTQKPLPFLEENSKPEIPSSPPIPPQRYVSTIQTATSIPGNDARASESSKTLGRGCNSLNSVFSIPLESPASTASTVQKSKQQALAPESSNSTPHAKEIPASKWTNQFVDAYSHVQSLPEGNPIFNLPLSIHGALNMDPRRNSQESFCYSVCSVLLFSKRRAMLRILTAMRRKR